jgi:hypothetical protein
MREISTASACGSRTSSKLASMPALFGATQSLVCDELSSAPAQVAGLDRSGSTPTISPRHWRFTFPAHLPRAYV